MNVVIHLGDFADINHLSSYDIGKIILKADVITKDIAAAQKLCLVFLVHCIFTISTAKEQKKKSIPSQNFR